MVYLDTPVLNTFDSYFEAVMYKNLCTITRAKQIVTDFVRHLRTLDVLFCTDRPSTHPSFGKRQGYMYGFYKDKKTKTQWNYLYDRSYDDNGDIDATVYQIQIGGLKDSLQFKSLKDYLFEAFSNN